MKGKLLVSFLLLSLVGSAQWSGYTRIANKYRYLAGAFDSSLHIPSGATVGLRGGANYRGALFYNTTDTSVYAYTGSQWLKVAGSSSLTAGEGLTESPAGTFKLGGTISGGDTTTISVSGGNTSIRFKGNNGLGQKFIIDSIRNFYVRGQATNTQISVVNNAVTLQSYAGVAYSNALFNGGILTFSATDSVVYSATSGVYRFDNVPSTDTTAKPAVLTTDGKLKKINSWAAVTLYQPIRTTTTNVTFGDGDYTVIVTGGTPSVTLPTASSYTGRIFKIVNHTGGGLTTSSHIDYTGGASTTVAANSAKTFQSNGTNWYQID